MTGRGVVVPAGTSGLVAATVIAALLAVAPAASAKPPAPDPHDVAFIGHLTDRGVPFASATEAIALAQDTCKILNSKSPTRIENAVMRIRGEIVMRPDQAQSFAETAVGTYCPGCADRLGLEPVPAPPEFTSVGSESELPFRRPQKPAH